MARDKSAVVKPPTSGAERTTENAFMPCHHLADTGAKKLTRLGPQSSQPGGKTMRFKRPSATWIVAVLALVLAVGTGSAVGARKLLTGRDIKNSSITGVDIRNHSLALADMTKGAANALVGDTGPTGPVGPAGPTGPAGPPGPSAISKITRVESRGSIGPGVTSHIDANCPSGMTVITGGFITAGAGEVFYSDSFGGLTSWSVGYDNGGSSVSADVTAVAYCATSGQAVGARSVATADREADARDAAQRATHR